MTEPDAKPTDEDPSMEDILASIRRILNDDPSAEPDATPQASAPRPPPNADDVFLLDQTMLIEEPPTLASEEPFASEHLAQEPPRPEITRPEITRSEITRQEMPGHEQPRPVSAHPAPMTDPTEAPLLAPSTTAAATASMGALVRVVGQQQQPVYRGGPTLEDMVRDEIRPIVKSWLDENLPSMVERMVRAEIARVTGGS